MKTEIPVGARVKVQGLKRATYANGLIGVVEKYEELFGSYTIDFGFVPPHGCRRVIVGRHNLEKTS